jgi:hypothetical protein
MAEAALLCWLAPAARSLAPQLTAVPPLAVFHDLRWLYGYNRPWFEFALLLVVVIAARSVLNATLIRLAWPAGLARPSARAALWPAFALTMAACVLLSPIVALSVGVAILPFSWPFFACLAVMLVLALPLSHGGIHPSWWRTLPPARAVSWLLADFALLSVMAAVIGRLPMTAAIPVSGLAGLANARAWYGLAGLAARTPARLPSPRALWLPVPLAPVALILAIASVIGLTRLAFVVGRGPQPVSVAAATLQPGAAQAGQAVWHPGGQTVRPGHYPRDPVLVIRGFGSTCCASARSLQPIAPGAVVQQFSYRGMTPAGQPLPQGSSASDLPLPELGDRIATQVRRLHRETGRPVNIVAESEGTLGVDAMLATHPGLPLGSIVMESPIVAPGRVGYPDGNGTGPGLVPADELRALVWFVGGLSPFGSSGAETLISSVDAVGARFAASAAQNKSLRWMLLVPLADAVTLPVCPLPKDVFVVPALHGDLTGAPGVKRMVRNFFAHQRVREPGQYKATAEIVAAAAAAWRMPETAGPAPACGQ